MKHRIVTAAQMKAIEQAGNAHGLPYLQMMENAGLAAYAELKNVLPQPGSRFPGICAEGTYCFIRVLSSTGHADCSRHRPPPVSRRPAQKPLWVPRPDGDNGCGRPAPFPHRATG